MSYIAPYVAILDVGHGNSTVLRNEDSTIIVDCGSRGSGLLEFLDKEKIYTVDAVFLSHADQDHIGGLIALLASDKFFVHSIYLNADSSKDTILWDGLAYELSQLGEKGEIKVQIGISRDLGTIKWGDLGLNIISPTRYLATKGAGGMDRKDRTITSNSISASFQVLWQDQAIAYLSGDIDQIALDDLVDHKINLLSPLLVFPHHGGNSEGNNNIAFTKQLCILTNPQTIIFSIGRNKHENPRLEVISTLRSILKGVRISCTQLSKNCTKELPETSPPHLLEVFSRGKEKKQCCGGTFIIQLGNNIQYQPNFESHSEFILSTAPTKMCI